MIIQDMWTASKQSKLNFPMMWNQDYGVIKTHKYVQALKEHDEFHSFLDQKVLMEPQWPDYNIIQNMLVRLYDAKRRVYVDPNVGILTVELRNEQEIPII